jgi:2'-5' RNA ligase
VRLFVALDIPGNIRQGLTKLVKELRAVVAPQARWVRMEGVHVTLKFIGETPNENLAEIRDALFQVRVHGPIDMRFAGLGFFPNARRPRVLWASIEADGALRELASAIETALEPLGIAREQREFSPHLTLARLESTKGLDELRAAVDKLGAPEFGSTRASTFYLYQSVLKRGGAEYTRLVSYPFAAECQEEISS